MPGMMYIQHLPHKNLCHLCHRFSSRTSQGSKQTDQANLESRNGGSGQYSYLLQMTSRIGCLPISTRSQAGETLSVVPRHSTRSACFACSSAVDRIRFSKLSPKLMIVFDKYPSQPYNTTRCGQLNSSTDNLLRTGSYMHMHE